MAEGNLTPEAREKVAKIRKSSQRRIARWRRELEKRVSSEKRRRRQRIAAVKAKGVLVPDLAVDFVAKWEGWLPVAYQDMGGVWTIGYGHTGPDVKPGMSISHKEGLRLLAEDMAGAAKAVAENVKVSLSVRQRSALISFTFNCGPGALAESTLLRRVNAKATPGEIREAFLMWVKVGGQTVQGLVNRREAEAALFNK